ALQKANGDYVFGIGADDIALPGVLEKSMEQLLHHPEAAICCSFPANLDHESGCLNDNPLIWSDKPRYFSPDELSEVIDGGYIAGHTCVGKRKVLLDAGGFIDQLKWHSDWFMWHVAAFRHGICFIPESLSAIRVLPKSYSNAGRRNWAEQKQVLRHLLTLLRSETYRDVLSYFVRGSLLLHFQDEIVKVVMEDPSLWNEETMMLIQASLYRWNKNTFIRNIQSELRQLSIAADKYMKRGYFQQAYDNYETLTQHLPDHSRLFALQAKAGLKAGFHQKAREAINKCLELEPKNADWINLSGVIYFHAQNIEEAQKCFQKALEYTPRNADIWINLAVTAHRNGQHSEAANCYQKAMELRPDDPFLKEKIKHQGVDQKDAEFPKEAIMDLPRSADMPHIKVEGLATNNL
ncbi:MAG: tetratricopeptide repeat protein, partial [Desulfosarcinaceae bacterium]